MTVEAELSTLKKQITYLNLPNNPSFFIYLVLYSYSTDSSLNAFFKIPSFRLVLFIRVVVFPSLPSPC